MRYDYYIVKISENENSKVLYDIRVFFSTKESIKRHYGNRVISIRKTSTISNKKCADVLV